MGFGPAQGFGGSIALDGPLATGTLPVSKGGTGATTEDGARTSLSVIGRSDRVIIYGPDPSGVGNNVVGSGSFLGFNGTQSNTTDASGRYLNYLNAVGARSGIDDGTNQARRDYGTQLFYALRTGPTLPVAAQRIWCGLADGDISGSDDPSATRHVAAFRYAPSADGTAFFRCYTSDGAGNKTVTVSTQGIAVSTRYNFRIILSSTDVKFYVGATLLATHTTNLPGASTFLKVKGEQNGAVNDSAIGLYLVTISGVV